MGDMELLGDVRVGVGVRVRSGSEIKEDVANGQATWRSRLPCIASHASREQGQGGAKSVKSGYWE